MTSPPLMSPPPAESHIHDKTPVKINGVVNKSKRDSLNGDGTNIHFLIKYKMLLYSKN